MAEKNADTYSLIASGVGYSKICNRNIPLPATPQLPTKPTRRGLQQCDPECEEIELLIDMVPEPEECGKGLQKRRPVLQRQVLPVPLGRNSGQEL
jgi:hypothetical protein